MGKRGGVVGSGNWRIGGFGKRRFRALRWPRRRSALIVALALITLIVAALGWVYWRVTRALSLAQKEVAAERDHAFTLVRLDSPGENSFSWISAPAAFSGAAIFHGHLYACGSAGLFEYDKGGKLVKHYRPGHELPATPLLRMTVGLVADATEPELLIATESEGVLLFDGKTFHQIRPQSADDRAIAAILPLPSRQLLIGTRKHGVLVYDGKSLRQFHPTLAGINVTELAGTGSDLWVGTMDQGVLHWIAGRTEKFGEAEGLPDKQVFSVALQGNRVYVGTAIGIGEFDGGRFSRALAPGAFARSLYIDGSRLLIGGIESGLSEMDLDARRPASPRIVPSTNLHDVQQIVGDENSVLAVTAANVYAKDRNGDGWRPVLSSDGALLNDRNISSLALDDSGRLWVGYFDHGLDLLDRNLRTVTHIEDEHIFCVNRILPGTYDKDIAVATANGLVLFDRSGKQIEVLGRTQGLIADHVTDVARYGDGLVVATPAGLTFLDRGGARSLYAFQGLVNNHVYSVAASGEQVVAGTLGGVSLLQGERVVSNFTVTTPGLKHNWISAVTRSGDGWMIGTYGGGIVRLGQDGRFEDFEVGTGDFEVYPNAILATEGHVLAGSLGSGLYSLNRSTNRWSVITQGLPSMTVTALAAGNGIIYIGTDNGLVRIAEQSLP